MGVEVLHFFVWAFLIYAVFFMSPERMAIPLIIIASIPLEWTLVGECPITALENFIEPLDPAVRKNINGRNRWGSAIRSRTNLTLREWDLMLALFLAPIAALCVIRVLIKLIRSEAVRASFSAGRVCKPFPHSG